MSERRCYYCRQLGGNGARELRPYGPGGADVCAGCVLGAGAPPEREEQARSRFAVQLGMAGRIAVIDPSEQAGPRRASEAELALLEAHTAEERTR